MSTTQSTERVTAAEIVATLQARDQDGRLTAEIAAFAVAAEVVCPTLGRPEARLTRPQAIAWAYGCVKAARKAAAMVAACPAAITWPISAVDAPRALCHWLCDADLARIINAINANLA